MPYIAMEALLGIFCGVITHRYSAYRELIWAGCFLMTLGTGLYIALSATSSIGMILSFEFIAGAGSGLLFQPVLVAIQVLAAQKDVATASATSGFVRNMAVSLLRRKMLFEMKLMSILDFYWCHCWWHHIPK